MRDYVAKLTFIAGAALLVSTASQVAVQGAAGPVWHSSYEPAVPVAGVADKAAPALGGGVGDVDTRYAQNGQMALAPLAALCANDTAKLAANDGN